MTKNWFWIYSEKIFLHTAKYFLHMVNINLFAVLDMKSRSSVSLSVAGRVRCGAGRCGPPISHQRTPAPGSAGQWGRHQPPRPGPALQTSSEVGGSVIGCRDNRTPREPGPATPAPRTALAAGRCTALLWTEGDTETGHRGEEGRLAGRRENEISKRGDKKIATIREK